MEVILKQYIPKLGNKDEVVNVKTGYATNYLIPQGLAIRATEALKKQILIRQEKLAAQQEQLKLQAEELLSKIQEVKVTVATKASSTGKIFGSVTNLHIAEELQKLGYTIDKKDIYIEHVKNLGSYKASINLHKEVKAEIDVEVIAAE